MSEIVFIDTEARDKLKYPNPSNVVIQKNELTNSSGLTKNNATFKIIEMLWMKFSYSEELLNLPYVMVQFQSAGIRPKHTIATNKQNMSNITFIVPLESRPNDPIHPYVLFDKSKMINILQFKLDDDLIFRVYKPDGKLLYEDDSPDQVMMALQIRCFPE